MAIQNKSKIVLDNTNCICYNGNIRKGREQEYFIERRLHMKAIRIMVNKLILFCADVAVNLNRMG